MAVKGIYTVPISATLYNQTFPYNTFAIFVCVDDDTFGSIQNTKNFLPGVSNRIAAKGLFRDYTIGTSTTEDKGHEKWDGTLCTTLEEASTVVTDVFGEDLTFNFPISGGKVSEILNRLFNDRICGNASQVTSLIQHYMPSYIDVETPADIAGNLMRVTADIDGSASTLLASGYKNYSNSDDIDRLMVNSGCGSNISFFAENTRTDAKMVNGVSYHFDRLFGGLTPDLYTPWFSGFNLEVDFALINESMVSNGVLDFSKNQPLSMGIYVRFNAIVYTDSDRKLSSTDNYSCAVVYRYEDKNKLDMFHGKKYTEVDDDPFQRGGKDGESGAGGGKGGGDNKSDQHPVPTPPSVSISDTGYFTIYNPTQVQMKQLSAKLWSGDFDLTNIKSLMSSPIENILSLAYVPLPVSGATAVTAKIGGADMGVTVNKIDKHFFQLDLGTVVIKEFYGSYLDYYPHTVVYIFLPYIGIISLDTNEVMGKTLHLVYNYDVVTGSVIAYISTNGLNSKLYEYNGNCIYNLPVTGRDFSTIISGALGLASSAVGAVVTHGASIPFSVGTVGQSLIDTQLPNYKHSGDVGGSPAIMDDRQPCVIIIRPRKINSKHQPKYTGYGSLITKKLSNVSGFTMVNDMRLNGISGATDIEIEEIRTMLKEGVVF